MSGKIIPLILLALLLAATSTFLYAVQATFSGRIWIKPDGSISPVNAPITRIGDLYTLTDNVDFPMEGTAIAISKGNTVLDGAGFTVDGKLPPDFYVDIGSSGIAARTDFYVKISNITIKNFVVENFHDLGIQLYANNSLVSNNTVLNCLRGIVVDGLNSTVIGNRVDTGTNRGGGGISIGERTNNCTIVENTIVSQEPGWLYNPHYVNDTGSGSRIYHNNFLMNSSISLSGDLPPNLLDNGYPSGGNYWSDYNGTDLYHGVYQNITGPDGIGDTPYTLRLVRNIGTDKVEWVYGDTNITDRYPLMKPYSTELVIPEFSSILILPLFITLTLLTSIIYFKKHKH